MTIGWRDNATAASVYQSRSYGEAAARSAGAIWDTIGDEDGRWRLPLCINSVNLGGQISHDAVSPYGYPGIWADPRMSADDVLAAWDDTLRLLSERDIVSVFLRFAPYRDGVERRVNLPGLELVELSETVLVELGEEAGMWAGMHGRSRTAIRKAEREGLNARVVMERPLSLGPESGFRNVYGIAMERVGATAAHLHEDEYYERLSNAEDVDLHLVEVRDADDDVVAAALLLIDEEAVHYHLSGSVVEAARNGANNLMIWTAMKWAAGEGHKRFHLGGGTSRADGLFRFKASFGGMTMPFLVGRLIVRPEAYGSLVTERARQLGVRPRLLQEGSFFPAYRAVGA